MITAIYSSNEYKEFNDSKRIKHDKGELYVFMNDALLVASIVLAIATVLVLAGWFLLLAVGLGDTIRLVAEVAHVREVGGFLLLASTLLLSVAWIVIVVIVVVLLVACHIVLHHASGSSRVDTF